MESGEINVGKKSASYVKVAQLHAACRDLNADSKGLRYFEKILQKEGDINYDIRRCSDLIDGGKYFSVLHSAYSRCEYFSEVYRLFLNHGADYKVKDNENRTVVHRAIHDYHKKPEILRRYVDPVLSAQVKLGDISNSCCKYGISHFHAACMTNHVEAVEFFLKNGAAVNEAMNADSPIFAGFTPLHFAAKYSSLKAAEILLKYGAEVHLKNVARMSSVHVLIKQKIDELRGSADKASEKFIKLLLDRDIHRHAVDEFGFSNFHIACILNDSSIAEDILTSKSLNVSQTVHVDSPICAGYTPFHFAATCNIKTVKLLLKNGADIEVKDTENVTPFDLCLKNCNVEEIHNIISSQTKWKEIKLTDGKTRLLNVVSAMKSIEGFSYLLSCIDSIAELKVPIDSSLWPGYTMLHLAVMFSEKSENHWSIETNQVKELLDRGADVTKKNTNNATALHLAFYLQKYRTVKLLLKHHSNTVGNPSDSNNLSHFHIACAAGDEKSVERFLSQGVVISASVTSTIKWLIRPNSNSKSKQMFLTAGSTALHISVACSHVKITEMLLRKGADIYAKDCNELTPIHRLLTNRNFYFPIREMGKLLLGIDGLQDSIAPCGISHLHVACYSGCYDGVESLLNSGADVNAFVKDISSKITREEEDDYFDIYGDPSKEPFACLSRYSGFTALDFSLLNNNTDIQRLLIERGADAISANSCERALVLDEEAVLKYLSYNNNDSRNRLKERLAIPSLHIACYSKSLELMSISLMQGDDVNARLPIPPRNTPLHILTKYNKDGNDNTYLIEFLLKIGADVTLRNDNGITAVDMFFLREFDYPSARQSFRSMLESIKDLDTNRVNSQGFSFFHYACLIKVVKVVEKFLENGIDVNRSVDYFGERFAGCSPLHLASGYQSENADDVALQLQVVELLLKYGADTRAEDARGNTPLHRAANCRSSRHLLFDILIRHGADVSCTNVNGEIALEILIKSRNTTWEDIECLLKNTTHVKFYNPFNQDRYIDHLFLYHEIWVTDVNNAYDPYANRMNLSNYEILSKLIASKYVTRIDEEGRNFLQNLFFLACPNELQYLELIRQLVKRGCNINHRDNEGKTILHLATGFRHNQCVVALLKNGADVNVTDNDGKTALAYCFDHPYEFHSSNNPQLVVRKFVKHLRKMEHCKLYISVANRQLQARARGMLNLQENEPPDFLSNIEKAKSIKMGSSDLTLFDFIEVDAEMVYPNMSYFVRLEIDQFFQHIDQHHLCEIDYLLKLKYERAREKMRLMSRAVEPFLVIIKNQLPALCCRLILSFLSCVDLENVIAATGD